MHSRPGAAPGTRCREGIDPDEIDRAWHLLRSAARRLDRVAKDRGWPTPFAPARYLILVLLDQATAYGLSARRLARSLGVSPSTLAHHLDVLEAAELIRRAPWTIYDRRKVAVRLTETGRYALRCFTGGQRGSPV
ncbi:MAG: MarR family transcriptional regulator [Gemmatimonadota bacterium]|jgi:DNA-binding MarR family transcriptional regulator